MTDLSWLSFLAEPWFVIPWYALGIASAAWAIHDMNQHNRQVDLAVKWAWPIILVFFSLIGLAFYLTTSRPPRIGEVASDDEQAKVFAEYSASTFRKVTGSVIHCVGGDGLGIVSAMVLARVTGMSFWQEYWLEYAVGYAFGWFLFQYLAMSMMSDSVPRILWMAARGEFFSMLTVMAGMGFVMGCVTPLVVGEQPNPGTFGFWGFAFLGLFVGFLVTFPMNWLLVRAGYKHGIGTKARQRVQAMQEAAA